MRDRIVKDRLIVKLFYTACCLWVGLGVVPLLLLIHDPDNGYPDARGIATVYGFIVTVLLPIWVPFVRRRYRTFPRSPLEGLRAIWAVFAPIAATFILSLSLVVPIIFMFDANGNDRLIAFMVTLVGAALVVLFSWDAAVDRDLIAQRQGSASPQGKGTPKQSPDKAL